MAQHRVGERFDIVHGHMGAAPQERPHLACEDEVLAGTGTCAPADHLLHVGGHAVLGGAGGADEIQDKVRDMIRHRDAPGEGLRLLQLFAAEDGLYDAGDGAGRAGEDLAFVIPGGVGDLDEEEETILLGLGERVRAFLLDGVLRGQNKKTGGAGQRSPGRR